MTPKENGASLLERVNCHSPYPSELKFQQILEITKEYQIIPDIPTS